MNEIETYLQQPPESVSQDTWDLLRQHRNIHVACIAAENALVQAKEALRLSSILRDKIEETRDRIASEVDKDKLTPHQKYILAIEPHGKNKA